MNNDIINPKTLQHEKKNLFISFASLVRGQFAGAGHGVDEAGSEKQLFLQHMD